jgi:rare lipoprotein A
MEYKVQRGDTIAQVSKSMGSNWRTLKELNPQAVGHSRMNGNWFFREGAAISDQPKKDFAETLKSAEGPKTGKINSPTVTGSSQNLATVADDEQAPTTEATAGTERTHTLKAGETVWELALKKYHVNPDDILKLNNITDPRSLQVGRTLRIPNGPEQLAQGLQGAQGAQSDQGVQSAQSAQGDLGAQGVQGVQGVQSAQGGQVAGEEVVASWYGRYHHGLTMANGEPFDMYAPTIAHKNIPLGTRVLLKNPDTGVEVTATVTDRGPYVKGRDVDLSYKLAQSLSLDKQGVGNLVMQVL